MKRTIKANNIIGEEKRKIATNIKRYRCKLLMSQQDLADLCGVHRTYISDLENRKSNPSLETLIIIACALGVSLYELMDI